MTHDPKRVERLLAEAQERILILDGAMGTTIQSYKLEEEDYRGTRFADWPSPVKGNNDLLCLTRPDVIKEIHTAFLEAGADIIGTNTFNSTTISQADYGMEEIVYEINLEGARLARAAADEMTARTPDKPRFVCGAMGPLNKTLSMSPDVNDPGYRAVTFDEVVTSYKQEAEALIEGGVDTLMVETIFDTLNAKAAVFAIEEVCEEKGVEVPIQISGTITDLSGRTLSGQTVEAFWYSLRHANPLSIGLNCSLGAADMRPYEAELSKLADTMVSAYPNAGLPNEFGEYDETPEMMAAQMKEWAEAGFLNIVGGCCGTMPAHIKAIAEAVADVKPRAIPSHKITTRLSGLEPLALPA